MTPSPRTSAPSAELSECFAKTLACALSKNPAERPSAEVFAQQLRAFTIPLGDSQILSVSGPYFPSEPPQDVRSPNHWQMISLLMGTVAVISVLIIAWMVLRNYSSPKVAPLLPLIPMASEDSRALPHPHAAQNDIATTIAQARISAYKSDDHDTLLAAARDQRNITVMGTVTGCHLDSTGNIAVLTFADNPDFAIAYREDLYSWMSYKFGGKDGDGIVGKSIYVTGTPTLIAGAATIRLTRTRDIEPAP